MQDKHIATSRGETLIEVMISVAIFAAISLMAINTMNSGVRQAESALQSTMARNEMNTQAEAIRFLHNNFVSEREMASGSQTEYSEIWNKITAKAIANDKKLINVNDLDSCEQAYAASSTPADPNSDASAAMFVINPRFLLPRSSISSDDARFNAVISSKILLDRNATSNGGAQILTPAFSHPRILFETMHIAEISLDDDVDLLLNQSEESNLAELRVYRSAKQVEGVWVTARKGPNSTYARNGVSSKPEYYDFYVQTCWYSPGSHAPSTLSTVVRLYNSEIIE